MPNTEVLDSKCFTDQNSWLSFECFRRTTFMNNYLLNTQEAFHMALSSEGIFMHDLLYVKNTIHKRVFPVQDAVCLYCRCQTFASHCVLWNSCQCGTTGFSNFKSTGAAHQDIGNQVLPQYGVPCNGNECTVPPSTLVMMCYLYAKKVFIHSCLLVQYIGMYRRSIFPS